MKKNTVSKIWINTIGFSSPIDFSKLCLRVEAKTITVLFGSKYV